MSCDTLKEKTLKWVYLLSKSSVYFSLKKRGTFECEGHEDLA
jgi:hypothetical protein